MRDVRQLRREADSEADFDHQSDGDRNCNGNSNGNRNRYGDRNHNGDRHSDRQSNPGRLGLVNRRYDRGRIGPRAGRALWHG